MATTRIRVKKPTWDTIVANSFPWLGSITSMAGTVMYCIPDDNQSISFLDAMGALKTGDTNVPNVSIAIDDLKIIGKNVLPAAYKINTTLRPELLNTTATCYLCCLFNNIPVAVPLLIPPCP